MLYGEKLKIKVIQSDGFIVKESGRFRISVLINNHQDFRNDDPECCEITDGCLTKYKNKGGNYIPKERTYDRSINKSVFIFKKISCDCYI